MSNWGYGFQSTHEFAQALQQGYLQTVPKKEWRKKKITFCIYGNGVSASRLDIINFHMDCFTNEAWNCRKWEHVNCENGQSGKQISCFGHSWHQQIINWFRTLVAVIRLREIHITKTELSPTGNCNCASVWTRHVYLLKCDILAFQH